MLNNGLRLGLLAIVTILLTSCGTGASDIKAPTVCPKIVEYSRDFQSQLADQLSVLPADSPAVIAILDYSRLRKELRLCQ